MASFKPVRVEKNGDIVITLKLGGVLHNLRDRHTDDDGDPAFKVTDAIAFAKEVATELWREEEDGTTLVHMMLDEAVLRAVDNGAEGVEEIKRAKR